MTKSIGNVLLLAMFLGPSGRAGAQVDSLSGLRNASAEMQGMMRAHLFDPRLLDDSAVRRIVSTTDSLARVAVDRRTFVTEVNRLWRHGPFSHVRLEVPRMSATMMAEYVDTMRAGAEAVSLRWVNRVAVLEVRTMMGVDTHEAITAAYREIVNRSASGLIIDLRANEGGAFAVVPLIGHVIDHAFDSGVFFGRRWTVDHTGAPTSRDVARIAPWSGWSISRFWNDVEQRGILRIRFEPIAPHYGGPVIVLTSERTASAAELAVDALITSGRVQVFGARTAGQMLSQRMFDLPGGLQLSLPIADYRSERMGRIEGTGVKPTVTMPPAFALDSALARLGKAPGRQSP